jgi:parallel beta-helix repeat protein
MHSSILVELKKIVLLAFVLMLLLTLIFNIQTVKAEPTTWTVDDDGPADFTTMQEAINHADEGDTIFVYDGTYSEPQVTIRKPLQLIGENKSTTIIDGGGSWVCVYVDFTHNVNISGFTIQNGYGIYSHRSENVTISGNIISSNGQGIVILESTNNTVTKNIVTLNAVSIHLSGSNGNKVCENIVTLNSGDSIWLDDSHGNIISGNNVSRNGLGTALGYHVYGIRLSYSNSNTIYHNYVIDNYEQAS